MRKYKIEEELDAARYDLERAMNMSEEDACKAFNCDSKDELIEVLKEEVEFLEDDLDDYIRENYQDELDDAYDQAVIDNHEIRIDAMRVL